jgi:hypothetical protein
MVFPIFLFLCTTIHGGLNTFEWTRKVRQSCVQDFAPTSGKKIQNTGSPFQSKLESVVVSTSFCSYYTSVQRIIYNWKIHGGTGDPGGGGHHKSHLCSRHSLGRGDRRCER